MPKGRGRKGSKAPPKKPKSIPVENRYELNPTPVSTSQSTPISGASVQDLSHHTYSPSSINISSSPSLNAPVSFSVNHLPPAMPFSYMSYPPLPPAFSSTTFPSPQGFTVDPTIGGHNPFRVGFVAGNISVCHGCKGKYFKDAGPPHDLCLQHEEWRTFTPQGSTTPQRRYGNVYYHCCVSCVVAVWPSFIPSSQVVIPSDVSSRLQLSHTDWLRGHFGLFV